ncbi:MAG: PEGA domain-containing protein [Ignavibacterium sp.]|nr:MAG: PEGA domain-containing protein [Ignavibacterium sp.]
MKNTLTILSAALLLLNSCKTNPPSAPVVPPLEFGKIFVTANVDGAKIFLDDNNTSKVTPDTVETTTGTHELRLEKEGYLPSSQIVEVIKDSLVKLSFTLNDASLAKVVLLEDFANVSCIPCVNSNKIIETLTTITYGPDKLVAIKYPTNFPGINDPFYMANSAACDARMSYYTIFAAPTTIIDGIERPISTDSISIKAAIDQQLQLTPRFYVEIRDSVSGQTYFVKVTVRVLDGTGLDFSNIVLHIVITETEIEFVNPPGSNGETKFYDVMRKMLPTNSGESLNGISQTDDVIFEWQTNIDPGWNLTHINTIAFIQNVTTKEVYQAGSTFE